MDKDVPDYTAANDGSFATGNIYGSGGAKGQP
jgi:hypothetical protein